MLGGRILGEGVDGCIFEKPAWPCVAGSTGVPDPNDGRYVSKIVPLDDSESIHLKLANTILGTDLAERYIAGLRGECKPADSIHPPNIKDIRAFKTVKDDLIDWKVPEQACERLKKKLFQDADISSSNKIMIMRKYKESFSQWVKYIEEKRIPYRKLIRNIEKAIPTFISILQKLYQSNNQIIHLDLHTGNIFIKYNPFEFGMADFGHCVFRQYGNNDAKTFYGEYLINNLAKFSFYTGRFSQSPFEACILNYGYKKHMEMADPYTFIQSWANDPEVRDNSASTTDTIFSSKDFLLKTLLKKPLFITMITILQSIIKKLRRNINDANALTESLSYTEKTTIEFILTRYHAISPFNTISQDIYHIYKIPEMTPIKLFIIKVLMAPYELEGSLVSAFKAIEGADIGIIWSDVISGKIM